MNLALVTPEEVPVHFRIGDVGGRVAALLVDLLLQTLVLLLVMVPLNASGALVGEVAVAATYLFAFVVRVLYFPFFELRWHGRTPGKRRLRLRVVARDGGPLTAGMVFARNLTRELEVFLPVTLVLGAGSAFGLPTGAALAGMVWMAVLVAIPLANRQRLRIGDLVAGTVVVAEPRPVLLDDLAETARRTRAAEEYGFTREQLELYGIEELQLLEDVLRRPDAPHRDRLLARIAAAVQDKVGWEPTPGRAVHFHPERFLRAFYAAQRAHLEAGLLSGERRERKVR